MFSTRSEMFDGRNRRYYILSDKGGTILKEMQNDWNYLVTSIAEIQEINKI